MGRALALALCLAGCGAAPAPTPPSGPGQLTLGSLLPDGSAVMPLPDGMDVTLVEGAQGGFHVWMDFRSHDVAPGELTLERTAHRLSDDQLVLRTKAPLTVGAPDEAGDWELPMPLPMFMCPSPVGLSVIDQPIVFRMRLLDGTGAEQAASDVTLVPHCPDGAREFCERICSG